MVSLPAPTHPPSEAVGDPEIASVTQQLLECGIFDFHEFAEERTDFFNPTICQVGGQTLLIVRRARAHPLMEVGRNDLVAFPLDGHRPVEKHRIFMAAAAASEHFEDPRAMVWNGRLWVSACNFLITGNRWTGAHQVLCMIKPDWRTEFRFDPVFGGNGRALWRNKGHEKNWLWFLHDQEPHLVYSAQPHRVAVFGNSLTFDREYRTVVRELPWKHGHIRGGSPPIAHRGEYWTFFHSSTPWRGPKRQYHMGCYSFEATPPFRLTRMTPRPILTGSQADRWQEGKPLVVFPGGALVQQDRWFVVFGVNDMDSGWCHIPHQELLARMVSVDSASVQCS